VKGENLLNNIATLLLEANNPGQLLAKLKLPFVNFNYKYKQVFEANSKFKAILHLNKRNKQSVKVMTYLSLDVIKKVYYEAIKENNPEKACIVLATITLTRINNLSKCDFTVKEFDDDLLIMDLQTKTTKHFVIISKKFENLLKILQKTKTKYTKLLNYCKVNHNGGTHICRRSGAAILLESKIFTQNEIKSVGNWKNSDILQENYLKINVLKHAAYFWQRKILSE